MSRSPNDPRNRHGRPRRTPPTIDLKATEVKGSGADAPGAATPPGAGSSGPAAPSGPPETVTPPADTGLVPDEAATTPPHGDQAGTAVADAAGATGPATDAPPAGSGAAETGSGEAAAPPARPRRAKVWPAKEEGAAAAGPATGVEPVPASPTDTSAAATPADPSPEPASSRAADAPRRPDEPRRSDEPALISAGLLGGLIGAGGALLGSHYLPSRTPHGAEIPGPREDRAALERRIAGLEQAQAGLADQARTAREAAQSANARLEAALRAAPAGNAAASPDAGQAGAQLQAAQAQAAQAQTALAALTQRLDALEADARNRGGATDQAIAALRAQVEEQSRRLAEASNSLGTRLTALDGVIPRLNAAETELKAQTAARAETNAAYDRRFAAQDQRLATQDGRLGTVDQRLDQLAKQVAEAGPAAVRAGLQVVLSDHLVQVLREGRGYAETIAALKRLNVDQAALAPLEPFAAAGAPTLSQLLSEFRPVSDRIIAASRPAYAQDNSLKDRLLRMADQIVSVRVVGDPNADDLPGLLARIEAALQRDAAGEAAAAWDALPESARKASEEWGRRLKARAAAENAARQISARALAGLEAPAR